MTTNPITILRADRSAQTARDTLVSESIYLADSGLAPECGGALRCDGCIHRAVLTVSETCWFCWGQSGRRHYRRRDEP